jgi:hypothetical protein
MAVDLKCRSSLQRSSVLLAGDAVIKLEHSYTQDRIYRCNYDRIQNVVIWSRVPVLSLIMAILLVIVSGLLLLLAFSMAGPRDSNAFPLITGTILALLGIVLMFRYLVYRRTTIRITRGGKPLEIEGVFSTTKLRQFKETLFFNIREAQRQNAASAPPFAEVVVPTSPSEPAVSAAGHESMPLPRLSSEPVP